MCGKGFVMLTWLIPVEVEPQVLHERNSHPRNIGALSKVPFSAFSSFPTTMAFAVRQLLYSPCDRSLLQCSPSLPVPRPPIVIINGRDNSRLSRLPGFFSKGNLTTVAKSSSPENDGIVASGDGPEDGVLLGTMKLPSDIDFQRFESLLFQWANSLCQGANLPLPVPLKVDKIKGGVRLGFITIGDGDTEVLVYIDCLVFTSDSDSGPIFRAIRNGKLKGQSPPGEPRIMRSLLQALQKSVDIARV